MRFKVANLGAQELLELGQNQAAQVKVNPPRNVILSVEEGKLIVATIKNIVAFAESYPFEFQSYCPTSRWQDTLDRVGAVVAQIEKEISAGSSTVTVPADTVLRMIDLEKCVTAARDNRLNSAKLSFGISAGGTIAGFVLGIPWLSIPTSVVGMGILFGKPLYEAMKANPESAYKPSIGCRKGYSLSGCVPPPETDEEKKMVKYLERVILTPEKVESVHYWGTVDCNPGGVEASTCLKKGRLRIRVEGWEGDNVTPGPGWEFADDCGEKVLNVVGVWETQSPRDTQFGDLPKESRHDATYWVQYTGPNTKGKMRKAGPFGCPFDTRDHAIEDSGFTQRGVDGDYMMLDDEGNPVDVDEEVPVETA